MPPVFTIAIPTYNRVSYLQQAVAAATAQTYQDIEILISDNGSSDGTKEWCRNLDDNRIRYVRSATNRGPSWNFANCLEQASGKYFSWLQDDDIIFSDFVARAVSTMEQQNGDCYLATAVYSPSTELFHWAPLYAPPVPMDWVRMQPRALDSGTLTALSLFVSVAIPPVIAFRTSLLRRHAAAFFDASVALYAERLLLVALGVKGRMLVAPHVAGVFRSHAGQASRLQLADKANAQTQWHAYAQLLDETVRRECIDLSEFAAFIATLPVETFKGWYETSTRRTRTTKFEADVHGIMHSALSSRTADHIAGASHMRERLTMRLLRFAKLCCPPIVFETQKAIRRACRG